MEIIDYITSKAFLTSVLVPIVSGSFAAAIISYWRAHTLRRKTLVAEAYKVALDRVEAVYLIRRRTKKRALLPQDEIAVRDQLHQMQRQTEYYKGLLSIEAKWFGESYANFVSAITQATGPLLKDAWSSPPAGPGGDLGQIVHPKSDPRVRSAELTFLADARSFFNVFVRNWRRLNKYYKKATLEE